MLPRAAQTLTGRYFEPLRALKNSPLLSLRGLISLEYKLSLDCTYTGIFFFYFNVYRILPMQTNNMALLILLQIPCP